MAIKYEQNYPITDRTSLGEYCLRQLGKTVVNTHLSPEQISDLLDDALQLFQTFHKDAVEKVYLKHQVTPEDITNKYVPVSPLVTSISKIFNFGGFGTTAGNIFDFRYQYALNDMYTFSSNSSMIGYSMTRQHLQLVEFLFNTEHLTIFKRYQNKLEIEMDWTTDVTPGQFLILEGTRIVDPEQYPAIYNDRWLKAYCTALFKKQQGWNLMKYPQIKLPGGQVLNGQFIYEQGMKDIESLRKELEDTFQTPVPFFFG